MTVATARTRRKRCPACGDWAICEECSRCEYDCRCVEPGPGFDRERAEDDEPEARYDDETPLFDPEDAGR